MINPEDYRCWKRFRTPFRLTSVLESVPDPFPPPVLEAVPDPFPAAVVEAGTGLFPAAVVEAVAEP